MRPSLRRHAGCLALLLLLSVAPLAANHVFIVNRSLPPAIAGFLYRARLISTVEFGFATEPATWTLVSGTLPPGLTIDTRGLISGTVPAGTDGTFLFTLRARDDRLSHVAQQEFVIPVIRPGSTELRIMTTGMWFASEGRRWEEYLDAVGGTPPYRWTLVQGTLPNGVQFEETGRLIGSIARGQAPRTYSFDVRVTDSANRIATASFTIPVGGTFVDFTTPSRLFTMLNTERFADGRRILPTLTTEGGICSGYQLFGSLPRGLVLSSEGAMLGVPSESGQFGFVTQCTDDFSGRAIIKAFNLLVLPQATLGSTALAPGAVGSAYSHTLVGQTSLPPIQYLAANTGTGALLAGNSPAPGLTLDRDTGRISGTPTTAGQYEFDVRVFSNFSHWFGGIWQFNTLTLNITGPATLPPGPISAAGIVNAASFAAGPIAPGLMITIFGPRIGPPTLTTLRLNAEGRVDTVLADTRVWFDDSIAPLVYVDENQISALVPYALAGATTTRVQVEHRGARTNAVTVALAPSAPGIFTVASSGRGQGAVQNQDFSVNSASNPAPRGSIVIVYATGEGQTAPRVPDGTVVSASQLPKPLLPVGLTIGGIAAEVVYAGSAPGLVAGVLQVNARVPEEVTPGSALEVVLAIGDARSQAGVTIAVRP